MWNSYLKRGKKLKSYYQQIRRYKYKNYEKKKKKKSCDTNSPTAQAAQESHFINGD